ncbi:hypothetical protein [Acinetobacter sp. YH12239]|uniref:hypothetical protein n=1 Tax=Acinetobacter sp. YH12239 TaxID=2601166 RepID=UPI0015D18439|nr:hypothetical protein [Acinetobacter sp. YH12239]
MSKFIKTPFTVIMISILGLHGCVRMMYPTSETELMSKSINGGVITDLEIDYIQAYANLKQAYKKCVEIKDFNGSLTVNSHLDRDKKMGTFTGNLPYGALFFKTTLEATGENSTKITYYATKMSALNQKLFHKRIEQDRIRALGQDNKCNKN